MLTFRGWNGLGSRGSRPMYRITSAGRSVAGTFSGAECRRAWRVANHGLQNNAKEWFLIDRKTVGRFALFGGNGWLWWNAVRLSHHP